MESLQAYLQQLSPLSAKTWQALQPLFQARPLAKGEYFIKAGEVASQIGFLEEGLLRAFYQTENGAEYNKHFFKAPVLVGGYASLITGAVNQIQQQALTDCKLWVADFKAFAALYDQHPDLERMARKLAEAFFVQKEQREIEMVMLDADARYQLLQKRHPKLEQQIPQYHIASYLGVTPTQLSRIRKKRSLV